MVFNTTTDKNQSQFVISTFNAMEMKFLIHFFLSRFWALASIWVIFLTNQGISLTAVAFITTAYMFSMAVSEIPTGYIADKFGRKFSVILAYFTQFTGILIFAFSMRIWQFMIGFAIWGVGMTMNSGAEQAWLYDEIESSDQYEKPNERYQEVFGIMTSVSFISSTLAYFAGGLLAEISLRLPIVLTALVFLFSGIWLFGMEETTKPEEDDDSTSKRTRDAIAVIKQPAVLMLTVVSMIIGGLISAMIYWIQPYFDGNISLTLIGLIGALGVMAASLGSSVSKKLSDQLGQYMIFFLVSAMALGFFFMSLFPVVIVIIVFLFMRALRGAFNPLMSTMLNREFSSKIRATALSVVTAVTTFTIMITQIATAYIIERYSFDLFYRVSSISVIAIAVPASLLFIKFSE